MSRNETKIVNAIREVAFDDGAWYGPMDMVSEGDQDLVNGWLIDLSQGTDDYIEDIQRVCLRLDCTREELQAVFNYYQAKLYPQEARRYNAERLAEYEDMRKAVM